MEEDKIILKSEMKYANFMLVIFISLFFCVLSSYFYFFEEKNNLMVFMFFLFFFLIGTYSVLSYHKIVVTNGGLKVYSLLGFIKKTIRRKDIVSYTIIKKQNTKYKHEVGYIEWEELTIYTKETKVKLYSTNYSNYRKLRKVLTKRGKRDIKKEKDWQKRSDRHWGIGFMSFGLFAIAYLVIISLNEVGFSSSLLFFVLIFLFIIYTGAKLYLRNK